MDENQNQCFVCMDDETIGELIPSPCLCKNIGIHEKCLSTMIIKSAVNACSICKSPYDGVEIVTTTKYTWTHYGKITLCSGVTITSVCSFYLWNIRHFESISYSKLSHSLFAATGCFLLFIVLAFCLLVYFFRNKPCCEKQRNVRRINISIARV